MGAATGPPSVAGWPSDDGARRLTLSCPWCDAPDQGAGRTCSACGRAVGRPAAVGQGALIGSRYEVEARLGAGGMGTVFRAFDRVLEETVAVKVVRGGETDPDAASTRKLRRNLEVVKRFRSEIKLARKVRHRNVCAIHEYGEDGELLYIAMELIDGRNLKQVLRDERGLIWEEVYDIALQTAEGLQAIHEAGVVHRDLKPANIMRDGDGGVRVLDFGIAKAWETHTDVGITGTGQIVGSPEYMSPERVRGHPLDPRSDIYSLGVVLFELFTGLSPFRADTPAATILKHLEDSPPFDAPEAARIPRAVLPALERMLAKRPDDRHSSCSEVIAILKEASARLAGQPTDSAAPIPDLPGSSESVRAAPAHPGPIGRAIAARAPLADSRDARLLVPTLARALGHPSDEVRVRAAAVLAMLGDAAADATGSLIEALRDEAPLVRSSAADALGAIGPGAGADALRRASHDQDPRVRAAASRVLAQSGIRDDGPASSGSATE